MKERFGGIVRLYGIAGFEKLQKSHVAIVGVGGVGCWAAEMLARSGVGKLTLIDADELCVTNINRQIHALDSTVSKSKVLTMAERIKDINPDCEVIVHESFFMESTADELLAADYDVVLDAIDSVKHKILLFMQCRFKKINLIMAGGAGGKTDPSRIQVADLAKTIRDPLLRRVRKELRKNPTLKVRKKLKVKAIFSNQEIMSPIFDESQQNQKDNRKLDCNTGYGTSPIIISHFGIRAADVVISELLK
ncbi:tRNA threonylcarbamoyladenosine dehydratase [Marinicella rhabdoformis]|uniref:tRNA threonylcarbamoyladenosine dehydratase n=1 Tax=Marinicella rhabdoformis TaxID=2580566 RepID=UPI0012AEB81E|nr:tRNA threonylcarbamoyladenosine dehydratase [Marinicella rhabdoformis]